MPFRSSGSSIFIKRFTGFLLLLATAAVFLFSGVTKLYSFDEFTWNIMDAGISNMTLAAMTARLFIGFELLLGIFLLADLYLKTFTYPAVIFMLLLFSVYLMLLMLRQGNEGNCGCFGETYVMSPSNALLKNVVMIVTTLLLFYLYPFPRYRFSRPIAIAAGVAAMAVPFIFFPPWNSRAPAAVHEPIDLSPLYRPGRQTPMVDLRKDKHIIAFMSLTCAHCKKAAFLLHVIHRQHPHLPIYMVLNGPPEKQSEFFNDTYSGEVPHIYFKGGGEFASMAGPAVPAIYWVNNSVIERKSSYFQLDPAQMVKWLNE